MFIVLLLIDLLTIIIILKSALFLRIEVLPAVTGIPVYQGVGILTFWWIIPVWLSFFIYEGLLTKRFSFWDEIRQLWRAIFFSTVAVFCILFLGKMGEKYSRIVIVLMGLISFFVVPVVRINAKRILMSFGLLRSKVLVLGAGETGELVAKALKEEQNLGYKVAGFLDDDTEKKGKFLAGVKVHNGIDKVERYMHRSRIDAVIISMPEISKERLSQLLNKLHRKAKHIMFIPDITGIAVLGTKLQHFFREQTFALEIQNNLAKPFNIFIKRCFDFTAAIFLLLILSIPIIFISILIKLDSPSTVIFSQFRVGRKGKPFRCFKFRTMIEDAENKLQALLSSNRNIRTEWEQTWKIKDDPRITKIGKFLRRTSIDELPQLINVLKGDMSLVGPRPVTQQEFDNYYRDSAELYLSVSPGITGLWQVSGRSNTNYNYRMTLDSWYVRNWNLWLDIVILLKTIKAVIKTEGSY